MPFRLWRLALVAATFGFIVAAIYLSTVLVQRQTTLEATNRSNVTSVIAQAVAEFARLQQRVSEFAMPGRPVDLAEVKLRVDVLANRLRSFGSVHVKAFTNATERSRQSVDELAKAVHDARAALDTLSEPGAAGRLLDRLAPVYPKLVRLSVDATAWNTARAEAERMSLAALQWIFVALATGLILLGLTFIVLLLLHNRLLQSAQERLEAQDAELQLQNRRFDAALNNMGHGLALLDRQQRVIVSNRRFQSLFGLDKPEQWQGRPLAELIHPQLLPVADPKAERDWVGDGLAEGVAMGAFGDHTHRLADGTVILVSHEPMRGGGWVSVFEDITERRRAQNHIMHIAHHDALTGLPNRLLFWEATAIAIRRLQASEQKFAVLYLDLDRFKEVNDTAGHPVGDALLREVALRLQARIGAPSIVARLGGDEFAILHPLTEGAPDASELALQLLDEIGRPYFVDGAEFTISTSIGIAVGPRDGETTDDLMRNADMALYRAKKLGPNRYQLFVPEFEEQLQERRALESDLRKALALGQLELYYQPLVSLKSYGVVCGEALLRWNHPTHGMVSPGVFIPLAEETGLIDQIGEWVLRRACADAQHWPAHVQVAVNLSPVQFRNARLSEVVAGALAETGLDPGRLELEITESVQLQSNSANLDTVLRLRALGCRIALDDFGTGYSSLGYLTQFQFDKIKIDQTFVRNLTRGSNALSIIQSIAALSRQLNIVTTAEGVETAEQLELVLAAGCVEAQGFYFSRPVPLTQFESYVGKQHGLRLHRA